MLPRSSELTRLRNLNVKPRKRHEFVWCVKTVDVPDLADDDSTPRVTDAGDSCYD